jgi:hypothetical protein
MSSNIVILLTINFTQPELVVNSGGCLSVNQRDNRLSYGTIEIITAYCIVVVCSLTAAVVYWPEFLAANSEVRA